MPRSRHHRVARTIARLAASTIAFLLLPVTPGGAQATATGTTSGAARTAPRAPLSAPVTDVRFDVTFGALEAIGRQLAVTLRFRAEGRDPVLLSLPAWTPGSYGIANFARHLSDFSARQGGRSLRWDKLDPDTWRVTPEGRGAVELTYRVRADSLDTAAAWSREDFAFFNGTTAFLMVEGRPETPARVAIHTEAAWRVTSAMTPADSQHHFRAADFHDLVDHPFFIGRFDLDSAEVAGRTMRLATYPVQSVAGARRAALWDVLRRGVPPIAEVFGEVPWTTYTVLQVVDSSFPGMSALEHAASELAIVGAPYLDAPFVASIHLHELVHAWNVKRLRPADLVPYWYDRPQPTPWLWMSEGVTDYYADLALVRSGLTDESAFLETVLGKIDGVEQHPVTALEDASLQAWLGMSDGTGDLYYDKGSLAGLALDILIRDASDNARSLDDVMRELWEVSWKRGQGFTYDQFWNAASRAAAGKALAEFDRRYIDGRDPYPWADWLPRAGWRIVTDSIAEPRLGALLQADPLGVRVTAVDPAGAGARAGLQLDDVITAIGGRSTLDPEFGVRWREFWGRRPGAAMTLEVRRGTTTLSLTATVEITTLIDRHIAPDPTAGERARRIRAGILRGAVDSR